MAVSPKSSQKVQFSIMLEREQLEDVERLARARLTSRSTIVRQALALFLSRNSTDSTSTDRDIADD